MLLTAASWCKLLNKSDYLDHLTKLEKTSSD